MRTTEMFNRIIISRTDSIGDVMLTLPMLQWIKNTFPESTLIYLGRSYTKPIIDCFSPVDQFVDWSEIEALPSTTRVDVLRALKADTIIHVFPNKDIASLAKKAKIQNRIGTSHRTFHLLTCNFRINYTRKKSDLHEAQLNFELLKPLGLKQIPSLEEVQLLTKGFVIKKAELPEAIVKELNKEGKKIVLHPKSQGSALEWPMEKYHQLALKLVEEGYSVIFTGTENEGKEFRENLPVSGKIIDVTGKLSLSELIVFISEMDALVACSTGPLHIAAYSGIRAVGLYSSRRPIHPGRWSAIGKNVRILVDDPECPDCKKKKNCQCIQNISVESVFNAITAD